mgnify:CR=1 FL=1
MFQCFPVEVINSLSSLELELLRYINSHKEDVVTSSIQDLGPVKVYAQIYLQAPAE